MRIAVNFPYFVPYSGYFRLFSSTDLFVIFDCVPFPRRGYVHRNQLPDNDNEAAWFTLPVNYASRDTCIKDMQLVDNINEEISNNLRRFPSLQTPEAAQHPLMQAIMNPENSLVDSLENSLQVTCELLDLPFSTVRSSSLPIDPELRGEHRVQAIVEHLGGDTYINAPGGRHLYDAHRFKQHGIDLQYLEPYRGNHWSILYRLLTEPVERIRRDIIEQSL